MKREDYNILIKEIMKGISISIWMNQNMMMTLWNTDLLNNNIILRQSQFNMKNNNILYKEWCLTMHSLLNIIFNRDNQLLALNSNLQG